MEADFKKKYQNLIYMNFLIKRFTTFEICDFVILVMNHLRQGWMCEEVLEGFFFFGKLIGKAARVRIIFI